MFSNVVLPEFSRPAATSYFWERKNMQVLRTHENKLETLARKKPRESRGKCAHFLDVRTSCVLRVGRRMKQL
jgi:glutaredoxin 2